MEWFQRGLVIFEVLVEYLVLIRKNKIKFVQSEKKVGANQIKN